MMEPDGRDTIGANLRANATFYMKMLHSGYADARWEREFAP